MARAHEQRLACAHATQRMCMSRSRSRSCPPTCSLKKRSLRAISSQRRTCVAHGACRVLPRHGHGGEVGSKRAPYAPPTSRQRWHQLAPQQVLSPPLPSLRTREHDPEMVSRPQRSPFPTCRRCSMRRYPPTTLWVNQCLSPRCTHLVGVCALEGRLVRVEVLELQQPHLTQHLHRVVRGVGRDHELHAHTRTRTRGRAASAGTPATTCGARPTAQRMQAWDSGWAPPRPPATTTGLSRLSHTDR